MRLLLPKVSAPVPSSTYFCQVCRRIFSQRRQERQQRHLGGEEPSGLAQGTPRTTPEPEEAEAEAGGVAQDI